MNVTGTKAPFLDKETTLEFLREKTEEGHSPAALAGILGVSMNTVVRHLKRHGIERPEHLKGKSYKVQGRHRDRVLKVRKVRKFNPPIEWVEEKLREGWSLKRIAEECPDEWGDGLGGASLVKFIKVHNIEYISSKCFWLKDTQAFRDGHFEKTYKNGGLKYAPPADWMVEQLKTKSYNEIAQDEGVAHSTIRGFVERSNLEPFREVIGHHLGNTNTNWWDGHDIISGSYWGRIESNAKNREIKFEITPDEAYEIYLKQYGKCAYTGLPIFFGPLRGSNGYLRAGNPVKGNDAERQKQTASLDRINSFIKAYRISNCQWVHATVNIMKNKLHEEEFLHWVEAIHSYSIKKCELSQK